MKTGDRQWYIIGFYLSPFDNTTIRYVDAAMVKWPRESELIFAGDLNVYLKRTGGRGLYEEIAVAVATVGLEDISAQFLPQGRVWN